MLFRSGDEAENAFLKALSLAPNDAETYKRLAAVRFLQGEANDNPKGDREKAKVFYTKALDSARQAIRISPALGEAHLTEGQILIALGRRKEGIEALRHCLRSRPEQPQAHFVLGKALAAEGQLVEARRHLQDAVRFAVKNDTRAKEALEQFEKDHPKDRVGP